MENSVLKFLIRFLFFGTVCFLNACSSGRASYLPVANSPSVNLLPYDVTMDGGNAPEPEDPLLKVLLKYSPDAFYIIYRYESLPESVSWDMHHQVLRATGGMSISTQGGVETRQQLTGDSWRRWIHKSEFVDQIVELDTAVHETKHSFSDAYAEHALWQTLGGQSSRVFARNASGGISAAKFQAHFASRKRVIYLPLYPTFPSKDIAYRVPPENRTIRFAAYVNGASSTQAHGIFGLLDEYEAYYWGSKVIYDFFEFFKKEQPKTVAPWNSYLHGLANSSTPWAEFRFFILTYLIHAREKEPKVFSDLMNDQRIRKAFTEIDDLYIALQAKIIHRLFSEVPAHLDSIKLKCHKNRQESFRQSDNGKQITAQVMALIFGNGGAVGVSAHDYELPRAAMEDPQYVQMSDQFRTAPTPNLPPLTF